MQKEGKRNSLEINAGYTGLYLPEGLGDVLDLAVQENGLPDSNLPFILGNPVRDPATRPEGSRGLQEGVQNRYGPVNVWWQSNVSFYEMNGV